MTEVQNDVNHVEEEQDDETRPTNKGIYWASFSLQIIILIYGIVTLAVEYEKRNTNNCTKVLINLVLIQVLLQPFGLFTTLWKLYKDRIDPRIRKYFHSANNILIAVNLFWYISILVIFPIIRFTAKDSECRTEMIATLPLSHIFGWIIFINAAICWGAIILFGLLVCCCGSCIICLVMTGALDDYLEEETADPGLPYLNRTQIHVFKSFLGLSGHEKETQCSICLEEYTDEAELRSMPCKHYFHQECIDAWLKNHSTCPICKQNIRNAEDVFHGTDTTV